MSLSFAKLPAAREGRCSDVIPQRAALRLFLAAIAGNEPVGSFIEIRWRASEGFRQEFWPVRATKSTAERIEALGDRGDVYVGAAPRTRQSGKADAIARGWTLWCDVDAPDALARLAVFTPPPSIVLLTGTPGHALALWPLRIPLEPAHLVRGNRRLAHAVGGDLAATDAARIVRVPGTSNYKHSPPAPVECVRLEIAVYTAREVVSDLPDPPAACAATFSSARVELPRSTTDDALLSIPADVYVPALTGREVGRDGKVQCPVHAGGNERTPSLHVYPGDRGWFCWPCDRGGSIVDFGALLYGIDPRGRGYHDIRRRLASDLLMGTEAAA